MTQLAVATVGAASGPLLYAFTLGLVAAVNPCGFPLLGAYLAFFVGDGELDRSRRNLRGVAAGASVTAGFVVVFT
ncbi:MAG: cytochrome c biogenesis CcdA family protein, partial [Acidimicrobiales bacterium]